MENFEKLSNETYLPAKGVSFKRKTNTLHYYTDNSKDRVNIDRSLLTKSLFPLVSLETFLNFRGHLGDKVSSVISGSDMLGKRYHQTVFDAGKSLSNLKRALQLVYFTIDHNTDFTLVIVVQDITLAERLSSHHTLISLKSSSKEISKNKHIKNTKKVNRNKILIVSNWVAGSLRPSKQSLLYTPSDNSVVSDEKPLIPSFVLVLGNFSEMKAIALEANYIRVPSAAVVGSNFSGYEVTYPIAGNDASQDFLFYVGSLFIQTALSCKGELNYSLK